jgi:hypothetical protein
MSPADTLTRLIKLDPGSARVVYAGLGLLAAATLVLGWQSSGNSIAELLPLAGWITGLGVLLTMLSYIVKAPMMRATLCWMVIAMIGFTQIYVVSAMFPKSPLQVLTGPVAPLTCVLRLQFDVNLCLDEFAPITPGPSAFNMQVTGADTQVWLAQSSTAPAGTTVYLQFADPVSRDQSAVIGTTLFAQGWGMQGKDQGGEQVSQVPDGNEVRYFNASDEASARALATALEPLTGTPVGVRDLSRLYRLVKEGQMEIWLAEVRPPGVEG